MGDRDASTSLAIVLEQMADLLHELTPEETEALAEGRLTLAVLDNDQGEP